MQHTALEKLEQKSHAPDFIVRRATLHLENFRNCNGGVHVRL